MMSQPELSQQYDQNPVWHDALETLEDAEHTTVNPDEITAFAEAADANDFDLPAWDAPVFPDPEDTPVHDQFLFMLAGMSLNYCFHDVRGESDKYTTEWLDTEWTGAFGMWAALKRSTVTDGPSVLSPDDLHSLTVDDARDLFDPVEGTALPLLDERTAALNELGGVITTEYDGDTSALFEDWFPTETVSARTITENTLQTFSSFADESAYGGDTVQFQKRAQLLPLMLAGYWQDGPLSVTATNWLTLPADYGIPATLRGFDLITVADDLAQRIDAGDEIPADSPEEVELRAATIVAGGRLHEALNDRDDIDTTIPELDYYLWSRRNEVDVPTHQTLTTAY